MIGYATTDMIPALKAIWARCFGDDAAYIDFIFARLLRQSSILVHTGEGTHPLSMLCIEPFRLGAVEPSAEECVGAYIFGVATLPDAQGRGLSSELLEDCHRRLEAEGYALSALVPAGESLFRYYGARGYKTGLCIFKASLEAAEIPPARRSCALSPGSLPKLSGLRDEIYADRPLYVRWDESYLRYIDDECRMLGGEVLALSCAGRRGYAVCYPYEDRVVIKELAAPEEILPDALAALHARFAAAGYDLYLPADTECPANRVLPFAMVRWYDREQENKLSKATGKPGWIAHVLD